MSIITSRIAYNVDNFGEQAVEMGFVHLKEGMELKDAVSLADERMFRCKRYIRGQR